MLSELENPEIMENLSVIVENRSEAVESLWMV